MSQIALISLAIVGLVASASGASLPGQTAPSSSAAGGPAPPVALGAQPAGLVAKKIDGNVNVNYNAKNEHYNVGNKYTNNVNVNTNHVAPHINYVVTLPQVKKGRSLRKKRLPTEEEVEIKRKFLELYEKSKAGDKSFMVHLGRALEALNPKYIATQRVKNIVFTDPAAFKADGNEDLGSTELEQDPEQVPAAEKSPEELKRELNDRVKAEIDEMLKKFNQDTTFTPEFLKDLNEADDKELEPQHLLFKKLVHCVTKSGECTVPNISTDAQEAESKPEDDHADNESVGENNYEGNNYDDELEHEHEHDVYEDEDMIDDQADHQQPPQAMAYSSAYSTNARHQPQLPYRTHESRQPQMVDDLPDVDLGDNEVMDDEFDEPMSEAASNAYAHSRGAGAQSRAISRSYGERRRPVESELSSYDQRPTFDAEMAPRSRSQQRPLAPMHRNANYEQREMNNNYDNYAPNKPAPSMTRPLAQRRLAAPQPSGPQSQSFANSRASSRGYDNSAMASSYNSQAPNSRYPLAPAQSMRRPQRQQ